MVRNISQIIYQLFQKETLDEVSESELRYFIQQYPYAGTGHLLLAKKLLLEGEKRAFEREIAVTSIYFNNPAWLQFVLQDHNGNGRYTIDYNAYEQPEVSSDDIPGDIEDEVKDEVVKEEEDKVVKEEEYKDYDQTDPELIRGKEEDRHPWLETEEEEEAKEEIDDSTHHSKSDQPVVAEPETISPEVSVQSTDEQFYDDGEVFAEFITEETNEELRLNEETLNAPWETEEEGAGEDSSDEDEPVSDEELRENFEKRKHLTSEVVAGDLERHELLNRDTPEENVEQAGHHVEYSDDQMVDRPDLISFEAQKASQRDPLPEEHENQTEHEKETIPGINTRSEEVAGEAGKNDPETSPVKSDAPVDVQKLEFDPYHTIDYFASQGIKLRLEDFSKDKLGQQLKSFTEWIRSMKRLPQQVAENSMDENAQHSIRRIAEHSVEEKEVLTESMAEVWIKQGNFEKARQIYRKLSLQNPSKSTYFAAKIDQLKVL